MSACSRRSAPTLARSPKTSRLQQSSSWSTAAGQSLGGREGGRAGWWKREGRRKEGGRGPAPYPSQPHALAGNPGLQKLPHRCADAPAHPHTLHSHHRTRPQLAPPPLPTHTHTPPKPYPPHTVQHPQLAHPHTPHIPTPCTPRPPPPWPAPRRRPGSARAAPRTQPAPGRAATAGPMSWTEHLAAACRRRLRAANCPLAAWTLGRAAREEQDQLGREGPGGDAGGQEVNRWGWRPLAAWNCGGEGQGWLYGSVPYGGVGLIARFY